MKCVFVKWKTFRHTYFILFNLFVLFLFFCFIFWLSSIYIIKMHVEIKFVFERENKKFPSGNIVAMANIRWMIRLFCWKTYDCQRTQTKIVRQVYKQHIKLNHSLARVLAVAVLYYEVWTKPTKLRCRTTRR